MRAPGVKGVESKRSTQINKVIFMKMPRNAKENNKNIRADNEVQLIGVKNEDAVNEDTHEHEADPDGTRQDGFAVSAEGVEEHVAELSKMGVELPEAPRLKENGADSDARDVVLVP